MLISPLAKPLTPMPFLSTPHLWFTDTQLSPVQQKLWLKHFTPAQHARLQRLSHPNKQLEFITSRALIHSALASLNRQHCWQIHEESLRPPQLRGGDQPVYTSLSHSHGMIGFTLAPTPIGLDIERCTTDKPFVRLAKHFMSSEEQQRMPTDPIEQADYFYRLWCSKEALYKALPASQQAGVQLSGLPASPPPGWQLKSRRHGEFYIAITSQKLTDNTLQTLNYLDISL